MPDSSSSEEFFDAHSGKTAADVKWANGEVEYEKKSNTDNSQEKHNFSKICSNISESRSLKRPTTLAVESRYDYMSLNDDGLLTPNSTVNSITADYTRELILSQNRQRLHSYSNGHSNDSISSPPSNSKSSSIERERELSEIHKRHSMESQSKYFSCSDFFSTENGNFQFARDDSIRSSLSSRSGKKGAKRSTQPNLNSKKFCQLHSNRVPSPLVHTLPSDYKSTITRSYSNPKFRSLHYTNNLNIDGFMSASTAKLANSVSEECQKPDSKENAITSKIDKWIAMKDQIDRTSISAVSSISSEHSSIASSASAMARRARSMKNLLSKTFRMYKHKSNSVGSMPGESSLEHSGEFKVKDSRKMPKTSLRHLDNVVFRQTLTPSKNSDPIITMKFNSDGNLLAAAGKDTYVYIWVVNRYKNSFNTYKKPADISLDSFANMEMEDDCTFCPIPLRKYYGHSDHVVDLSWSYKPRDNWLLSCSIDKTIKLWHISKHEVIVSFSSMEIPKAILFHPKDNCKFIVGFLDGKIELWNIPNRKVTHKFKADSINKHGSAITSILFLVKREQVVFGTMDGRCILLNIRENDFSFHTELSLSDRSVTGIEPVPNDPNQILVTTTDCRIRCYSFQDNSVICRYKGFTNNNSLGMFMKGVLSPDGRFIASGSEDGNIYSWEKCQLQTSFKNKRDKNSNYQYIKCHNSPVHSVQFAPYPSLIGANVIMAIVSSDEKGGINLYTKSHAELPTDVFNYNTEPEKM